MSDLQTTMASDMGSSSNSGKDAEQYTQEFIDVEENFTDTSSDSPNEEDDTKACKRPIVGQSDRKRSSGALALAERRLKNTKLDQVFVALQSVLPGTPAEEPSSVSTDAHHPHDTLKRQISVDDLLNTDFASLKINTARPNPFNGARKPVKRNILGVPVTIVETFYSVSDLMEHPIVEVNRVDGSKLELHIASINRAGVLKNIVAALDLKGSNVLYSNIKCRENVLSVRLSYVKKKNLAPHLDPDQRLPVEAEDEALKETILGIIHQGASDNKSK